MSQVYLTKLSDHFDHLVLSVFFASSKSLETGQGNISHEGGISI